MPMRGGAIQLANLPGSMTCFIRLWMKSPSSFEGSQLFLSFSQPASSMICGRLCFEQAYNNMVLAAPPPVLLRASSARCSAALQANCAASWPTSSSCGFIKSLKKQICGERFFQKGNAAGSQGLLAHRFVIDRRHEDDRRSAATGPHPVRRRKIEVTDFRRIPDSEDR
jgi:hypothetical protein